MIRKRKIFKSLVLVAAVVLFIFTTDHPEMGLILFGLGSVWGPRALIDLAVPTGLDGSVLFQFELQKIQNFTPQDILTRAAQAIGAVNERLTARYGGMIMFKEMMHAIYEQGEGSRSMTPKRVEFSSPDGVRSDTIGHMIEVEEYEDEISWTRSWLERAYLEQINADLNKIARRWENRVDYEILWRALFTTEKSVGSAGYNVGWVNGGSGNVDFVPPEYQGKTFDATHDHYLAQSGDTSADVQTLLKNMVATMRHHGHRGLLTALVSDDDVAKYTGMENFIRLLPQGVIPTNNASDSYVAQGTVEGVPGEIFGYYLDERGRVELRTHYRIPTTYTFMFKSYGLQNANNPIAIRLKEGGNFGLRVEPMVTNHAIPRLQAANFEGDHGVGVADRVGGVAGQFDSASYSNPTNFE